MSSIYNDSLPDSEYNLVKMLAGTRQLVEQRKSQVPLAGLRALAGMQRRTLDLSSVLRHGERVALIPRLRRSNTDTAQENSKNSWMAKQVEAEGAQAIALALNYQFYHHSLADLTRIAQASNVPIIRYDVIFDEYQIVEARAAGADAVLLMATLLEPDMLRNLISITQRNRMTSVVQVQNEAELTVAIEFEPQVMAITNRNMDTFAVDLDTTPRLRPLIPKHIAVVSVGGLHQVKDVAHVYQSQLDGIIVGHDLLTDPDATQALQELFQQPKPTS